MLESDSHPENSIVVSLIAVQARPAPYQYDDASRAFLNIVSLAVSARTYHSGGGDGTH
jgi:hypothetical protein